MGALKDLVGKGYKSSSLRLPLEDVVLHDKLGLEMLTHLQADGVSGKWHDLLLRLDVTEWWSQRSQRA